MVDIRNIVLSVSNPVNIVLAKCSHCSLLILSSYSFLIYSAAPTKKPAVPQAGSHIPSSGVGLIISTIILIICLGVRNIPAKPADESFPSIYSYTSPCISLSAISCWYKSSRPVIIFCNTNGVGIKNIASSIYFEKAVLPSSQVSSPSISISSPCSLKSGKWEFFIFFIAGNTLWDIILKISTGSLSLNLLQRIDWPFGVCGNILSISFPIKFSNSSVSISFSSRERINIKYVNCSITVSGFVTPPAAISSHILSILFLIAPVIIIFPPDLLVNLKLPRT